MPTQFTLPPMGESIKSGTVAKLLVSTGDRIEEEQPVLELETDKAVQEVPATLSGTVGKILVKEGDQLAIGQPVFEVETGDVAAQPAAANGNASAQSAPQNTSGQAASNADSEESSFANTSGIATGGPTSSNGSTSNGASSNGNQSTLDGQRTAAPSAPQLSDVAREPNRLVPAAPSVRRIAREMGVDIRQVKGSGSDGRISAGDVQNYATGGSAPTSVPASAQSTLAGGLIAVPVPDFAQFGEVERKPMSGIRRATAEQMQRSWSSIPHVTQFDKADITDIEALRKQYGKAAEAAGGKLTITAIILKVVVGALKKFPQFNASLDAEKGEVVYKKYFNIGVAVDTERGLLVPVIRNVERKNLVELAVELGEIAERARNKKTTLEEMQGGCFTITNLGGIGGTAFTPIVNAPEVAILGLSRGVMEPVWNGSEFQPRLMMPMSLSFDHRVIDGADGARFLRFIANTLEQPFLMALEG
jgi:pyruvate dehydrogenase E2 component (dihydrolipoamide acetyltransferase)